MKTILIIFVLEVVSTFECSSETFEKENILFTTDLYREFLKLENPNILISPLSVKIILTLVHAGAEGNTAEELAQGVYISEDNHIIKNVVNVLRTNSSYILNSLNRIYLADRFMIRDEFKNVAENVFNSNISTLNFTNNTEAASIINQWVETESYSKIKNLINADHLNSDTVAVLINTMYFKGAWSKEFGVVDTKAMPFFINSTNTVDVDMMRVIEYFNYHNSLDFNAQFLELPYYGEDVTMTIVLPYDKEGLKDLEDQLQDVLEEPSYKCIGLKVAIPKFRIESKIDLKPIIQSLGIVDAFTTAANFSKMTTSDNGVYISNILQKTFIEIDEKGTSAGAATYAVSSDRSLPSEKFVADHPFMFFLKHKDIGIVFIGKYSSPDFI